MTFDEFLIQAWSDHQAAAEAVASRLAEGERLLENTDNLAAFVGLATHIYGEHLGRWADGVAFLRTLEGHRFANENGRSALARSIASLELANSDRRIIGDFGKSDQIRILAVSSAALLGQKQSERAQSLFVEACEKAAGGLEAGDPAIRALAVTGNNLACDLEEASARTDAETHLMILAAQTARKYWELAGTWLQVERSEYRLAHTYLKAGNSEKALVHARECLRICMANDAEDSEIAYAKAAVALAEKASRNSL